MRRFLTVAALSIAVVPGGCGEKSETDQVTEAIESSYEAFAEGDADAFCESLSPDYLGDFKDYWDGCDSATLDEILTEVTDTDAEIAALENPEISDVEIRGDVAGATVNGSDFEVVRVDGEWKLDDFDVPGGE